MNLIKCRGSSPRERPKGQGLAGEGRGRREENLTLSYQLVNKGETVGPLAHPTSTSRQEAS